MAKTAGRLCVIKKNGTTIAGMRNVSFASNGQPIDVSDQGDGGWLNYLAGVLVGRSVVISGDGYEEDQVFRDLSLGAESGWFLTDITFEFPNGDEISGNFVMTQYEEGASYDDGQTFSVSLSSNGTPTYTQA